MNTLPYSPEFVDPQELLSLDESALKPDAGDMEASSIFGTNDWSMELNNPPSWTINYPHETAPSGMAAFGDTSSSSNVSSWPVNEMTPTQSTLPTFHLDSAYGTIRVDEFVQEGLAWSPSPAVDFIPTLAAISSPQMVATAESEKPSAATLPHESTISSSIGLFTKEEVQHTRRTSPQQSEDLAATALDSLDPDGLVPLLYLVPGIPTPISNSQLDPFTNAWSSENTSSKCSFQSFDSPLTDARIQDFIGDSLLLPEPRTDSSGTPDPNRLSKGQTGDQKAAICTYDSCGARFSRVTDLRRHHNNIHLRARPFPCTVPGCPRVTRGFARKDKRDEHRRKIHMVE